ncbi:hypothetical protein GQF49_06855 [Microbacter sp. ANSKLAB05]|nr:hypothetical protein [Microbacter sp. ANSKLAB05]
MTGQHATAGERDPRRTGWRRYRRIGEVRALRLDVDAAWDTREGDRMTARRGDWRVEDSSGGVRTVTDSTFRASHRHLRGDVWERCAVLEARPAAPGESAVSQEGTSTAGDGDWVVRDSPDNSWVVPGEHFRAAYVLDE